MRSALFSQETGSESCLFQMKLLLAAPRDVSSQPLAILQHKLHEIRRLTCALQSESQFARLLALCLVQLEQPNISPDRLLLPISICTSMPGGTCKLHCLDTKFMVTVPASNRNGDTIFLCGNMVGLVGMSERKPQRVATQCA